MVSKWVLRRRALNDEYKRRPCTDCGDRFNPWQMDWDHLPQFKKVKSIAFLITSKATDADIAAEIEKCELVCSNCHRNRTHYRKLYGLNGLETGPISIQ